MIRLVRYFLCRESEFDYGHFDDVLLIHRDLETS
jgi:hypothetical protein